MSFKVSDRRVGDIRNKSEYATPELLAIYMQTMQASKANESVPECSKTGLCVK